MTDQVRREEIAESELLNTLLDAADAPAAQTAVETPDSTAETVAQPTPEPEAVAPAAGAAEAEPMPAAPQAAAAEGEADGASFTPVAEATIMEASETDTGVSATPVAEVTTSAEAETSATPVAEVTTSAEAETSATPVAEAPALAEAETSASPVAEAPASAEAGAAEGASFTPVAEEPSRPRRLKDLQPGMDLDGRVTSIALYGIFVDIGVGRDGLVHISEMSETRIDTPSDLVQIGDTVKVRIKSIDPDARRISLTMRTQERGESRSRGRPKRAEVDKDRIGSLKAGDVVEGTITGFAPFGAFADIGVGKDGLIHVSELAEGRVEKPEDAVKVGDRFAFKILEIDPDGTRISLSLRRAMRTQKMQQLEPGQILDGTVSGIAPFGAFVDIGVGRDGLVHISALSTNRVAKVEDVVKVGDKVQVRVLEVDQQSKRISLTMRLEESEATVEESHDAPAPVIPRTGPASTARFAAAAAAAREGREKDRDRGERGDRRDRRDRDRRNTPQPVATESYSTADEEEEFVGDATLEDLLSKFGSASGVRRDRKGRREDEVEEEGGEDRNSRRQRDVIRRTLQQVGRDE